MARDIYVDQQELEEFIEVLQRFQDSTSDRFKSVQSAWSKCSESWEGVSKETFEKDFEETNSSIHHALEAGDDAIDWLRRFNEILEEFEEMY